MMPCTVSLMISPAVEYHPVPTAVIYHHHVMKVVMVLDKGIGTFQMEMNWTLALIMLTIGMPRG